MVENSLYGQPADKILTHFGCAAPVSGRRHEDETIFAKNDSLTTVGTGKSSLMYGVDIT